MNTNVIWELKKLNWNFAPIPEYLEKLNNFIENGVFTEPETDQDMFFYGLYFEEMEDFDNMKKYYLMAIEKGNELAMNNLGMYYYKLEDYEKAKEYLIQGAEKDGIDCIVNLGTYYNNIEKNLDKAVKQYEIGVEKENVDAMFKLGLVYKKKKDYENMMKYFTMVFEKGDDDEKEILEDHLSDKKKFNILGDLYFRLELYLKLQHLIEDMIFSEEKITPKIIELIEKSGEHFDENCHPFLQSYYKLLKSKVDLMKLHFDYSEQGKGYHEAKKDFYDQIKN